MTAVWIEVFQKEEISLRRQTPPRNAGPLITITEGRFELPYGRVLTLLPAYAGASARRIKLQALGGAILVKTANDPAEVLVESEKEISLILATSISVRGV